jgi:sortase A
VSGKAERVKRTKRRDDPFLRPREPHDWRWVVGGVGRVLISTGVLLFAFVAYQLWGTGIQTARAQDRLSKSFESSLEQATPLPTTGTTVPATSPATSTPTTTAAGQPDTTTVPTTSVAPTTTAAPIPVVAPPRGEPLARLQIASIGVDNIVVEGVRTGDLKLGPGHFPETPLPGQYGNAAIAGHRTTYGQPFYRIDEIKVGDEIVVTTAWGKFVYVAQSMSIVSPDDYAKVIPTSDPSVATLTLASCHPRYTARQRYVVLATIDPTRSSPVTKPGELGTPDVPAPTTVPATTLAPTGSTLPSATTTLPSNTGVSTTIADGMGGTGDGAAIDGEDAGAAAFSSRWFSDRKAFVPVALWGLRLIVIALVATAISKLTRRNWVGALVGIGPFVVTLYFFFENVSRLLPANL